MVEAAATTKLRLPSDRGTDRRDGTVRVKIDIADPMLAARVRSSLFETSLLAEVDEDAMLILTDRAEGPGATLPELSGALAPNRPSLSPREQEVASLLLEGASNKTIARRLDISVHTAKFHVARILTKLNAQNRADAVSIVLRDGLVSL